MFITHNNKVLGFKEIYSRPLKEKEKSQKPFKIKKEVYSSKEQPLEEVSCITKTGHFYFGKNRTFLNWLYTHSPVVLYY